MRGSNPRLNLSRSPRSMGQDYRRDIVSPALSCTGWRADIDREERDRGLPPLRIFRTENEQVPHTSDLRCEALRERA